MRVHTTAGLVERDLLDARDVIEEDENARVTATEWYLDGVLVRRDVWVNVLKPAALGANGHG